jgi:hypothetical protein
MPIVSKRIRKYFGTDGGSLGRELGVPHPQESEVELLKTIKFSKNIFKLKLP